MTDATDPPKKLSLADLIGYQGDRPAPDRPATTIADAAREADQKIDWQEEIRTAKRTIEEPRVLRVPSTNHLVDTMRENTRRLSATEEAERRTVAALEAMRQDALAARADNAKMLWWARAAGIAGIVGVILAIVIPIAQAMWTKTP